MSLASATVRLCARLSAEIGCQIGFNRPDNDVDGGEPRSAQLGDVQLSEDRPPPARAPCDTILLMSEKITLLKLIATGTLAPGTILRHKGRTRHNWTVAARVTDRGLSIRDHEFTSPSGAARSITRKPVNGWCFWRLPDGRELIDLRAIVDRSRLLPVRPKVSGRCVVPGGCQLWL